MNVPSFSEYHISQIYASQMLINMEYYYTTSTQTMAWCKDKEYELSDINITSAILALKEPPIYEDVMNDNVVFYNLTTAAQNNHITGHTIKIYQYKNAR